jgi:hypothetical protein
MTIAVQCHADVDVAEPLLHDLGVHVPGQQQRGARVPQVMEPDLRQPGGLRYLLEEESMAIRSA